MGLATKPAFLSNLTFEDVISATERDNKEVKSEKKIDFKILNNFGKISNGKKVISFTLVDWDGVVRFDLRRWTENYEKPLKGISFTKEEIVQVEEILKSYTPKKYNTPELVFENGKMKAEIYHIMGTLSSMVSKGVTWNKQICIVDWGYGPKYDFRKWTGDYSKCSKGISLNKAEIEVLVQCLATIGLKEKSLETQTRPKEWVREEVVILVAEYFRTRDKSTEEIESSVKHVSNFLRRREQVLSGKEPDETFRNYNGIKMQRGRIQSLDPETHHNGMNGTKLQMQIVSEYIEKPEEIMNEAKMIYEKYR